MDLLKYLAERLDPYLQGQWPLLVVGFSGGRDSVALTYALRLLQQERDFALLAAHFDHGLRGAESDGDREFCRKFCESRGIEFVWGRAEGLAEAADRENRARRQRYGWLEDICGAEEAKGYGPVWLVTAHHREDQAETVLLHLLRGGGGAGLAAMRERRGRLLRPLLGVSRRDIEEFLAAQGLDWREDSSNAEGIYTRNRLRHDIMPRLREINPQAARALAQTAEIAAAEEDFWGVLVAERMERAKPFGGGLYFLLAEWEKEPLALRRRLVRELWRRVAKIEPGAAISLSFELTERVVKLAESPCFRQLHLSGGIVAENKWGWLLVRPMNGLEEIYRQKRAARSRAAQKK